MARDSATHGRLEVAAGRQGSRRLRARIEFYAMQEGCLGQRSREESRGRRAVVVVRSPCVRGRCELARP